MQEDYKLITNPKTYSNKKEVTNTDESILVAGSQNVLISDADKVVTRSGSSLFGAGYTTLKGIKSSYEWDTSSARQRALRAYDDELEVYVYGAWRRVKDNWKNVNFSYTTWWSSAESIDLLIFVNGDDNLYEWSGAITKIASVTVNTLTKMFIVSGTTYSFTPSSGSAKAYISDSASGFVTAGFSAGDVIVVSGSASNDKSYTIFEVTASTITLIGEDELVSEASGATVTIAKENYGSWAEERFLTAGTRSLVIGGLTYTYTGGETTGTLTGVTCTSGDPVTNGVANGDIGIQSVRTTTSSPIAGNKNDVVSVLNNQLYVISTHSREVYVSNDSSFSNFAFTSPVRVPGEGALLTLDDYGVSLVPQEDSMYIAAGKDSWYQTHFELTSDGQNETLTIKKLKTAPRGAPISHNVVSHIKNNVVFISNEPTLDTLGRVEQINTPQSVPISDPIKNDFDAYDFNRAHVKYYKNNIYVAVPEESVVLVYDLQNTRWQPPQIMDISRLAIIDGELYGHSANKNETYKLFDPAETTDNGIPIPAVARYAYRNFGARAKTKTFDEYFSELYLRDYSDVLLKLYFDYLGATEIKEFDILGNDTDILFQPVEDTGSIGSSPLGQNPLGGTLEDTPLFSKARVIHTMADTDFFEYFAEYSSNTPFQIISHGGNVGESTNIPANIKK